MPVFLTRDEQKNLSLIWMPSKPSFGSCTVDVASADPVAWIDAPCEDPAAEHRNAV